MLQQKKSVSLLLKMSLLVATNTSGVFLSYVSTRGNLASMALSEWADDCGEDDTNLC